ncbi:MAG: O-antigen ligase family protein [Candidatus Krumholzibacteriia bacterium]
MAAERTAAAGLRLPKYGEHAPAVMALFLVWVVARYMQWSERLGIFAATRFEFVVGIILIVACVGLMQAQPVPLRPGRTVLIAIVLLFAAMLVQLPFAADPVMAKNTFIDRVIKFAFLTFFMMVLIQSPRYLRWFLYAFLFACFYITQEAVRGLISGGLVWENQGVMRLHGAVPMYMHPNSLSGCAMGTIPFIVFLFPFWRRWYLRAGLLALAGTALTCVLYSGSRTAYVGFLAFALFWWLSSRRKLKWLLGALVVAAIALAVIPAQYKHRFTSIGGHEAEGASKEARIEILRDAWQIFIENPGGIGVASFPAARLRRFGRIQDTHNLYLEVATNLGVQGFLVFLFLVGALFASCRRARRRLLAQAAELAPWRRARELPPRLAAAIARQVDDLRFLAAVATATAGFIYVRLVLGFFGMDLYEVYWWFGAGLAIVLLNLTVGTARVNARLIELARGAGGDTSATT